MQKAVTMPSELAAKNFYCYRLIPPCRSVPVVVAENIRRRIVEKATLKTSTGASFNFTISIGVLEYDGHPDYQRFFEEVDKALYMAKNNGRNNVSVG